jgi:hypothetical protein
MTERSEVQRYVVLSPRSGDVTLTPATRRVHQ